MTHPHLISVDRLAAPPQGVAPIVLDVRWSLDGPSGAELHAIGHVPGAVAVDLDTELAGAPDGSGSGRHPLPEPQKLQSVLRAAGIDDDAEVVVYDGADGAIASRAWWLLRWAGHDRVGVLDGGYAAWTSAGHPVSTDQRRPAPGSVVVRPGRMPVADADGAEHAAAGPGLLLDARAGARFRGESEPADPAAGHVPGSVNAPAGDHLGPDGRWRSVDELRRHYEALGVTGDGAVVVGCGSGVTACSVVLALELTGLSAPGRPAALWPGSWSGWCELGRAVETGPGGAGGG